MEPHLQPLAFPVWTELTKLKEIKMQKVFHRLMSTEK